MGASEWILPEHLPEEIVILSEAASGSRYMDGVRRAKLNLVRQGLEEANGDRREAARILGIDVTYLYRLIKSLNIV
jgi:DNA-binding NtrC family response regulator